ncbi:MAG: ComF family protein [Candidatus Cloacimonetes bacterium]|nr:ComF family protein [Candidatus Cloacimonadota bacterium]
MKNPLGLLVDLVFPPVCLSCGTRITDQRYLLCPECSRELEFRDNQCLICGSTTQNNHCQICQQTPFIFNKAVSIYDFNRIVRKLLHELKYNELSITAKFLADRALQYIQTYDPFPAIDWITCVPLHRVKERSRGYNQSGYLARFIAKALDLKYLPDLTRRVKFTETQTRLSREQRLVNVQNAFRMNRKYNITSKNILLVDDVFTTGATLNSISKCLKNNQVGNIYVLTIARA